MMNEDTKFSQIKVKDIDFSLIMNFDHLLYKNLTNFNQT